MTDAFHTAADTGRGSVRPGSRPESISRAASLPDDATPAATAGDRLAATTTVRLTARVRGRVQGVGFRWWVRSQAMELGLAGSATNCADGSVEVIAEGPRQACGTLLAALDPDAPAEHAARRPGRVSELALWWGEPRGDLAGFVER